MIERRGTLRALIAVSVLVVAACGQSASTTPVTGTPPAATPSVTDGTVVPPSAAASLGTEPQVTLVQIDDATDPSASGEQEIELTRQLREETGIAALIGADGQAALDGLDAIQEEFAQELIADVAAAIDAGELPQDASGQLNEMLASAGGDLPLPPRRPFWTRSTSAFSRNRLHGLNDHDHVLAAGSARIGERLRNAATHRNIRSD